MTWSIREETTMSGKIEACAECSRMCHVMHQRNRDPSSTSTSFFKILFGADYSDFLFLPQKFASSVPYLIDQEAQLEDSSGEQWTVKLSNIEDSLAFEEGWSAFSEDHRLKVGEMLVFHYIYPSRFFFVQIYGASGCPKYRRDEDNGNSNKRARTEGDFGATDEDCHMNDNNNLGSNGSVGSGTFDINECQPRRSSNTVDFDSDIRRVPVVSETRQYEEQFCIIDRDDGYMQGDDRSCLYDLSKYEVSVKAEKLSNRGSSIHEFPTGGDMLINDSVNPSVDLIETCIEKPEEIWEKIVVIPYEEAVCRKAEKPSIAHPINPSVDLLETCIEKPVEIWGEIVVMPEEEAVCQKAEKPSIAHPNLLETCIEKPVENWEKIVVMPEEEAVCQKAVKPSTTHPIGSEKSSHEDSAGSCKSSHQEKTFLKSPTDAGMFDNDSVKVSRHVLETFASQTLESRMKILQMLKKENQIAKERSTAYLAETMEITKTEKAKTGDMHVLRSMLHGTEENGIKEGSHTFGQPIKDDELIYGVVKEEPVDFDDTPLHAAAAASCLVVIGSENYVELPTDFPSITAARGRFDRRVVHLRGPDTRPWPVMYIQKFGVKILNAGWEAFSIVNGIQPGDECRFQREDNQQECIFRVSITNRQVNGA